MNSLENGTYKLKDHHFGVLSGIYLIIQIMNPIGYVTNAMGIDGLFSLVSRLYIVLCLGALFFYIFQKRVQPMACLYLIFMVLVTSFCYILSPGECSLYNYCVLLAGYLALPIYMIVIPEIKFTSTIYYATFFSNCVTALFFIYCGFFRPEYYVNSGALTMGFFNANQAGIFLAQNIAVLSCCIQYECSTAKKILLGLLCGLEGYFVFLTQSRMAAICTILLIAVQFKRKKMIPMKYVRICFVCPFLMIFVLLRMAESIFFQNIMVLGKPIISGRELIYLNSIMDMQEKWVFGNFGLYQFTNLHNAYLTILATSGIVGMVMFAIFYWKCLKKFWRLHSANSVAFVAFIAILLLFIEGSVESAILVSGSMYAGAATAILMFLNCKGEKS